MTDSNFSSSSINSKCHNCSSYHKPLLVLISLVVLMVVFCSGLVIGRFVCIGRPFSNRHGVMFSRRVNSFRPASTYANEIKISGVVTAINGNTINVGGDGVSNTVYTDSQTVYSNSTKPSVNDTVRVLGSISNSKFTAQKISIFRY